MPEESLSYNSEEPVSSLLFHLIHGFMINELATLVIFIMIIIKSEFKKCYSLNMYSVALRIFDAAKF